MPEDVKENLTKHLTLAVIFLLAGGGGTTAFLKASNPDPNAGNQELVTVVNKLARIVDELKSNPNARADPYTGHDGRRDREQSEAGDQALREYIDKIDRHHQQQIDAILRDLAVYSKDQRLHNEAAGEWKGKINSNIGRIDRLEKQLEKTHR